MSIVALRDLLPGEEILVSLIFLSRILRLLTRLSCMHYAGVLQLQCTQGPSLVPEQLDSAPDVS